MAGDGELPQIVRTAGLTDVAGSTGTVTSADIPCVPVSVAIPTRNRPTKLKETVESVLAGSLVPAEIVVSDQSTDEATRAIVEEMGQSVTGPTIRYIRSLRPGSSANRNDAFRATSGVFIAFVDDDIRVERQWLERLLREWEEGWARGPVLIAGRILSGVEEDSRYDPGARLSDARAVFQKLPRTRDLLYGGAFGADRTVIDRLGPDPFDERLGVGARFRGGEDEDFGYRALKAGFPVIYEPSIIVTHFPETEGWRRSSFTRSFGGGAFFAKHIFRGDRALLRNFGWVLFIQMAKSFRSYLRFQAREGTMRLLSFAGLLAGFLSWAFSAQSMPVHHTAIEGRGASTMEQKEP